MAIYNRGRLSKAEKAQVPFKYNEKGQKVDPNRPDIVLKEGQIDLGHKYGYEERMMQKCAKKCGMSQRDYTKMMKNPDLYQWEDMRINRGGRYECKNTREQRHNCMQFIRSYRNKDSGKNLLRNAQSQSKNVSRQHSPKGQIHLSPGGKGSSTGGGKGR